MLIPVKNRYDHTDLNELTIICRRGEEVVFSGRVKEDIPPHTSGALSLECAEPGEGEALCLQFYNDSRLVAGRGYVGRFPL